MEARRVTKEEEKEGTKDGTRQEVAKEPKEEVKASSHTPRGPALSVEVKGISPKTAQGGQMR